jgi:hypothetical protein
VLQVAVDHLHPDPPPCQQWHRGGDLQDAGDVVQYGALESAAVVILPYAAHSGSLLCAITRRGGGLP